MRASGLAVVDGGFGVLSKNAQAPV